MHIPHALRSFEFSLLAVGVSDTTATRFAETMQPIKHCQLMWEREGSIAGIDKAFGSASKHLRELRKARPRMIPCIVAALLSTDRRSCLVCIGAAWYACA
jgi:hypothetical protein